MTAWMFGYDCTVEDYLAGLSDEVIADLYAIRHSWNICPGDPYRYQTYLFGGWYRLASLPTRQEMIAEIIQQESARKCLPPITETPKGTVSNDT